MKANIVKVIVLVGLLVVGLVLAVQAGPPVRDAVSDLSTPQLIEAAQAKGEIDADTANLYLAYALTGDQKLPARYRGTVPWDGTLPLLRLRQAVKTMTDSVAQSQITAILSEICSTSTGSLPNVYDSTHFHIEYNTIGGGLTVNSYATSLETAWNTEVTTFGWAAPPVLTGDPLPGNRYHVRIDALGTSLYGFVSTSGAHAGNVGNNPNTAWNDVDAYATCMVLNEDYFGFPGSPQQALDATAAHEFNHSIQFGYGALTGANTPDDVFAEGGATWMEDEVFDSANDNYNYLWPTFSMCMGEYTNSPYRYWITFRGLTEPSGTGVAGGGEQVMQDFWEATSKSASSNMLPALNAALVAKGTTLANAYHAYAIAVKFNKTCGGGYVYPYCFEEAAGYVAKKGATAVYGTIGSVGDSYTGSVPDNYALNWIGLPASSAAYQVTLHNTSTGGTLRGSVVCDTGSTLRITPFPATVGAGASTSIASYNPAGCSSVVAVLTNQAQTADNPTSCELRSYSLETSSVPTPNHRVYLPYAVKAYSSGGRGSLANGDFESGSTAWVEFSSHGWPLILPAADLTVLPHGGNWAAWLGGGNSELSSLQQQVTVPAGSPQLVYWHWIQSSDECGYDFGRVVVNATIVDEYDLCITTGTVGWVMHTVELGAYAGQSVSLRIEAQTDGSWASNLFVDDVSFQ